MIFDSLVAFLLDTVNAVLALFPAWSLPFSFPDLMGTFYQGVRNTNAFFPVVTLGACIGAVFGLRLLMLTWSLVTWAYDKIPGKFT